MAVQTKACGGLNINARYDFNQRSSVQRERVIRHSNEALLLLPLHKHSKNVLSAESSRAAHRQPDTLHREGTFKIFNREAVLNFTPLTWEPQLSFSLAASQSAHEGERYGKRTKPGTYVCVCGTDIAMPILCVESSGNAPLSVTQLQL